jgi:hypothetical protein
MQELLGHSSIINTADTHTHLPPEADLAIAEACGAARTARTRHLRERHLRRTPTPSAPEKPGPESVGGQAELLLPAPAFGVRTNRGAGPLSVVASVTVQTKGLGRS